jgi:hypothetical protein
MGKAARENCGMTEWRPLREIRVKALGLALRDGALLAAEVLRDDGSIKGVRPLGGSIEFGETRKAALMREFVEETGSAIDIVGPWLFFENIFEHEGAIGHEMIFAAKVRLLDPNIENLEIIDFIDGVPCKARWFRREQLKNVGLPLFPSGLDAVIGYEWR